MGTTGFGRSPPGDSKAKNSMLPRKLLPLCGPAGSAPFPRKQRSAVKKPGRCGSSIRRKDGAKKAKVNKKRAHVTKDELEVAEALRSMADIFTDASNAAASAEGDEMNKVTACPTTQVVFSESSSDPQQHGLPLDKHAARPDSSELQNDSVSDFRQNLRTAMIPKGEPAASEKQVSTLPATESIPAKTRDSRLSISLLPEIDHDKKKSLKRCSNHVYISRLIKVLKLTVKEESAGHPTRLTISGEPVPRFTPLHNENKHSGLGELPKKKEAYQHTKLVSDISSGQTVYNGFLSCGTMAWETDTRKKYKGGTQSREDPKAFVARYTQQSQSQSSFPFSAPKVSTFHGNGDAQAAQQLQGPQYMMSSFPPLATQYNSYAGAGAAKLSEWPRSSAVMLNYPESIFPHLYAPTRGSKFPQLSPQPGNRSDVNFPLRNDAATFYH